MAPHSSTLAWKIPWMEEPGRLQSMGSWRVGHDWATSLSLFTFMHWRRKWQLTPVFLPGESQGQRSLVGCHLWGRTESDTIEATQQQQQCLYGNTKILSFSYSPFPFGNHKCFQSLWVCFFLMKSNSKTSIIWYHLYAKSKKMIPHLRSVEYVDAERSGGLTVFFTTMHSQFKRTCQFHLKLFLSGKNY